MFVLDVFYVLAAEEKVMVSKYAQEERRRRKAEQAAQISVADYETLDLMRQVRRQVGSCELMTNPRAIASQAVYKAIEEWAELVTGKPKYFHDVRNS
jgi:hypothetical protein